MRASSVLGSVLINPTVRDITRDQAVGSLTSLLTTGQDALPPATRLSFQPVLK